MRAVTFAAAGAAVITTVSATSHVKHMHAKLHENVARDTWVDWNTTTSNTPVDAKTTTTTKETPVKAATTSSAPATTSSSFLWEDWSSSSSLTVDPAKASTTTTFDWADWEASKSSEPVDPATTSSATTSSFDWADWESSTSVAPVDPATTSTETWGDWDAVDPTYTVTAKATVTETDYESWADWATSTPVDPASTATTTWGDWTEVEETTTITLASTITTTKYVEPISTDSTTWADWDSSSASPVAAASTSSAAGAAAWSADPHGCVVSIITSYGAPTWYPTPVYTTNTTTATWADWTSSSSAAVVVTATAGWGAGSSPSASASSSSGSWSGSSGSTSGSTGGSSSGSGGSGIHANGDSWGLTYSPYTAQGGCKDAGTVAADLAIIAEKGFSSVRVYSTDCGTLENIGGSARANGLKLILGVWISSTGISGAQGQVTDIINWGQWDLVELIVVGNEAVFNGYASAGALAGFISSSAWAFKNAGYTGSVTTTEPLSVWEDTSNAAAFCSVVDVVGANLYAFFNAEVTADQAGTFIQSEIDILNGICSGKAVVVLESGWPHAGNCNGAACPSVENQATALKGIQATAGAQVVFLSYEDEPWKEPGQFDVEQFWGCASVF